MLEENFQLREQYRAYLNRQLRQQCSRLIYLTHKIFILSL